MNSNFINNDGASSRKLKLKRAQTQKPEPADRVIEEGSDDDNSFTSGSIKHESKLKYPIVLSKKNHDVQSLKRPL
jgi:hypothetical protein